MENIKGKFAVVKLWPKLKVAEDENIARLKISANFLGYECLVIDKMGYIIDKPKVRIDYKMVDFVIHLHFETPKCYDAFSFVALWNPTKFYHDWGYLKFSKHLITHDDFLSCNSPNADDHVNRLISSIPNKKSPHFKLFHSLSEPILNPNLGERKIFYIGINWEKIDGRVQRHYELLKALDKIDAINIFGPKIFKGVNVWGEFKNYVKPLRFDGTSIIHEIAKCGIGLVLSSDAHKESELMSNRLFECAAAGVIIICDENKFATKYFGDSLLYIDTSKNSEDIINQILNHLEWVNNYPKLALNKAKKSQQIFLQNFTLSQCLRDIYKELPERKKILNVENFPNQSFRPKVIQVILIVDYDFVSIKNQISNIINQKYNNIVPVIVITSIYFEQIKEHINNLITNSQNTPVYYSYDFESNKIGELISSVIPLSAKENSQEFFFNISGPQELLYHNHISSLLKIFERNINSDDNDTLYTSYNSMILRHKDENNNEYADLIESLDFSNCNINIPFGLGRFLFSSKLLANKHLCFIRYLNFGCIQYMAQQGTQLSSSNSTIEYNIQDPFHFKIATTNYETEIIDNINKPNLNDNNVNQITLNPPQLILDRLSTQNKIQIAVELFHSLPIPMKSTLLKIYRFWYSKTIIKNGSTPS